MIQSSVHILQPCTPRADLEGAHRARATPKIFPNTIYYYNIL